MSHCNQITFILENHKDKTWDIGRVIDSSLEAHSPLAEEWDSTALGHV